jgi:2-keto-3-deoxy-L-rhamnonate aldolase RhmA
LAQSSVIYFTFRGSPEIRDSRLEAHVRVWYSSRIAPARPSQVNMPINMPIKISEVLRNNVKEMLARDEVVASMTVRLVRSVEIARIARTAGFDTIYVDVEHSSFSLETTSQICMAALEVGIAPFVRVPSVADIQRALDGGALGVIVPHVGLAADARAAVKAAKFPPLGERSAAGPLPHLHYRSFPAAEANAALDAATMVIVQFESAQALARADEIVAVEGVDTVLIGTNDLLADWGIPGEYEHPRVREAYAQTIAACRRHGKHVGVGGLATRPKLAAEFVRMGARYVSTGTDLAFLLAACGTKAKEVRDIQL